MGRSRQGVGPTGAASAGAEVATINAPAEVLNHHSTRAKSRAASAAT